MDVTNRSGVSVEDIVIFTLFCSEVSRLRERRLQDESSDIFAHTTSARHIFSNELTEVAIDVKSHFESSVSEIFTVEVVVTVTADDDDVDIPACQHHVPVQRR